MMTRSGGGLSYVMRKSDALPNRWSATRRTRSSWMSCSAATPRLRRDIGSGRCEIGNFRHGTGTDRIVIAAPQGDGVEYCVGLHTDIGEAIGRAVYDAAFEGARTWNVDIAAIRSEVGS
ncbi:MAG: hypothetical protein C3F11_00765 [Methylocystaceae bacterium]|nr:MAG: hypothetical protein C3F11_00765 [Methylocystaceae bacterium]